MADDKVAGGATSTSETQDWERRNTDPTIPFDGSAPENIPGPISNVELELAAGKRAAAHERGTGDGADRLRPEHAKQAAKTGDAVTDSDVLVNPAADLNVGDDAGAADREKAQKEGVVDPNVADPKPAPSGDATPEGRATRQQRQAKA